MALFGTDGARGVANHTLTATLAFEIAKGAAAFLPERARVLIARDTRVSGPLLESALSAGFLESGVEVMLAGVVPTPALAYLIGAMEADAGVMISASHNPPQYNGIKLLDRAGRKWEVADEEAVENTISQKAWKNPDPERIGRLFHYEEVAPSLYRNRLVELFAGRMPDWSVVLDVGHGASGQTAPEIFTALGLRTQVIHGEPLGDLINVNCGATHPEKVREAVLRRQANLGLSFDGDADRVIAVDGEGRIVDGDEILYVLARYLKSQGKLPKNQVVATVMTNLGMERALEEQHIELLRTPVGDRFVAQELRARGAMLGGEQSGHVILKEWTETGDGVLTGLALMVALKEMGLTLAEAVAPVVRYPQILRNVPLETTIEDWRTIPGLEELVRDAETALGQEGRVLIRLSGTEPLLRIMLEGRDVQAINEWAHRLEAGVRQALESAEA